MGPKSSGSNERTHPNSGFAQAGRYGPAPSPRLFGAGFAERTESFDVQDRVHRLRRSVHITTAAGHWSPAADAHAAAAERDAAGPFEVVASDDARHRDHVAFARFDLVEQFLLAGQSEPASGLDLDALALAFGALGHDERAALRAAGDGHSDG